MERALHRRVLALAGLATLLSAQQPARPFLIATSLPGGNPAAQIVAVDVSTGAASGLPRFTGDTLRPLAIAIDPYDGHVLLAIDQNNGASRLLRITGFAPGQSYTMAEIPGRVSQIVVQRDWLVVASDDALGGVFRVPRRGGEPSQVFAQANVTAMVGFALDNSAVLVAWSGRPGSAALDTGVLMLDSATGQVLFGPLTMATVAGREITGISNLPTGLPQQLLSFSDGAFALIVGGASVVPLAVAPPPPNGGAVAMQGINGAAFGGLVLGGSPFPFLYEVDVFAATAVVRSAALPGTPVDYAIGLSLAGGALDFGEPCGAPALASQVQGVLQPGNTIALDLTGAIPGGVVALVAGLDDFAGGLLPLPVLGPCLLHVTPDSAGLQVCNGSGSAQQGLAIPLRASLIGARVFCEWVQPEPGGFRTSVVTALQVGL